MVDGPRNFPLDTMSPGRHQILIGQQQPLLPRRVQGVLVALLGGSPCWRVNARLNAACDW
jgi:hypothetical protein